MDDDRLSVTTRELRIVSLLPSATEIVCALGLEQQLVGVTHECDYPHSVRGKPVLTSSVLDGRLTSKDVDRHIRALVHRGSSIYQLDAGRLDALRPDLVLTQELCRVCAVSYSIVEQAVRRIDGTPQLVSLEPESLEDAWRTIEAVGRLTGNSGNCPGVNPRMPAVEGTRLARQQDDATGAHGLARSTPSM